MGETLSLVDEVARLRQLAGAAAAGWDAVKVELVESMHLRDVLQRQLDRASDELRRGDLQRELQRAEIARLRQVAIYAQGLIASIEMERDDLPSEVSEWLDDELAGLRAALSEETTTASTADVPAEGATP